jgi:DNA polymerase I-like protein with 3'-5' exonuclease and polymerase domains
MKRLVLDVETTISNKGNPFDETNKLCYVGLLSEDTSVLHSIEYSSDPYGSNLLSIQRSIDDCELLIGFNIKFDLHWIRRYGITFSNKRIWDCQLVHFILSGQTASYPSLNGVAAHYGLGTKLDVVSTEYWKNGIDTPDVPRDILEEYLQGDLDLTYQVYLKQLAEVQASSPQLQRLISLHNQDLLVLEEMEYNGLLFDETRSAELAEDLTEQIRRLDVLLMDYHNTPDFNSNSTEHLSALLYGGTINLKRREVIGVFKTGTRAGQPKERWVDYPIIFPKLITPLRGSELAKDGFYSTDEATLKSLKGSKNAKELVELLLRRATLEKRLSTYYEGLVKLRKEMKWSEGKLHGQLNQCVARTGRLSSSRPNLQNFDGEIKELFRSRYVS